jgi:hypothetical protein
MQESLEFPMVKGQCNKWRTKIEERKEEKSDRNLKSKRNDGERLRERKTEIEGKALPPS